jgi:hypothetical protein
VIFGENPLGLKAGEAVVWRGASHGGAGGFLGAIYFSG